MHYKVETFEERSNEFFNAMLSNLNPRIYKIKRDSFVFQDEKATVSGIVEPNAEVSIYINGILTASGTALGDGSFSIDLYLVNNENNIRLEYIVP